MDDLEARLRFTTQGADAATLQYTQENIGQFAIFVEMLQRGEEV